jgi:hypothetical protein
MEEIEFQRISRMGMYRGLRLVDDWEVKIL